MPDNFPPLKLRRSDREMAEQRIKERRFGTMQEWDPTWDRIRDTDAKDKRRKKEHTEGLAARHGSVKAPGAPARTEPYTRREQFGDVIKQWDAEAMAGPDTSAISRDDTRRQDARQKQVLDALRNASVR